MCVQISRSPGHYTGHQCNIPLYLKRQDSNSSNGLSAADCDVIRASPMLENVSGQKGFGCNASRCRAKDESEYHTGGKVHE